MFRTSVCCILTKSYPRFIPDRQHYEVRCQDLKGILHLWKGTLGFLACRDYQGGCKSARRTAR